MVVGSEDLPDRPFGGLGVNQTPTPSLQSLPFLKLVEGFHVGKKGSH